MMEGNFIAGSANIDELDPAVADMPIQLKTVENAKIDTVMSNSFGFGGTNATLVLKRWQGKSEPVRGRFVDFVRGKYAHTYARLLYRPAMNTR